MGAQLAYFRARRRVVVCDLRGHGASTGDPAQCDIETYEAHVSALLHVLDLPRCLDWGCMGGRVVLQAYVEAPERVAGLVLVDGSRLGTGDPQTIEQAVRQQIRAVGDTAFLRGFFDGMFLAGSDPALKERIVSRALTLPEAIGSALFPRVSEMPTPWTRPWPRSPYRRWSSRVPTLPPSAWLPLEPGASPLAGIDTTGGAHGADRHRDWRRTFRDGGPAARRHPAPRAFVARLPRPG